jgi:DNA adenine methylase
MNEDMSYARATEELLPLDVVTTQDSSVALTSLPMAKPFLRWAGGKTRLLPAILPYVPARFGTYHEPFLGSGALFFSIRERATHARLSDLNAELINLWQVVRDRPLPLLKLLEGLSRKQGEAAYYEIRQQRPRAELQRAARFFYLNQTSWNGLWRENKFGVYNVPWGARAFRGMEKTFALAVASALQHTTIERQDFRSVLAFAKKGDFVYLDPPYLPVSDTSKFSGYNGERFRLADLEELAKETQKLTKRGVRWVMSNRDNEVVRELFGHADVVSFTTRRSVAAQNKRHVQPKDSPEAIVVGRI